MASVGHRSVGAAPYYEDERSLKEWIRKQNKYHAQETNLLSTIIDQAGTAGEVDLSEKGGQTIAEIGKTEIALKLTASADNAETNGKTFSITYVDSDGVSHTCTATGTATLNGTPIAFTPAISDMYAITAFSVSAAMAVVTLTVITSGGATVWATISVGNTAATEAQLQGVGAVYGATEADHADGDAAVQYIEYITPWGEINRGHCTFDTNAGGGTDNEIQYYEATDNGDGTTTATTVLVKDFYRLRWWNTATTPTANTHAFFLCNADHSVIYGAIEEGYEQSLHTAYYAPAATYRDAWISSICIQQTVATNLVTYLLIKYTPKGASIERSCKIDIPNNGSIEIFPMIQIEPLTDVNFLIKGNLAEITSKINIIEAVLA